MNNCIGLKNQKAFLLFNFYTMITAGWTCVRVSIAAYECSQDNDCDSFSNGVNMLAVVMLILCGVFTLFTAIMFCDQTRMIYENTSTIDRMQARRAAREAAANKTA